MKKEAKESKTVVYVPPGAKANLENISDSSPKTKYERRRFTLDINGVKKIVGGLYGKSDD